jgi:L-threonylcarbamoyladenylate synthase
MPRVDLDQAVARLASGGLVAIPTETVYGLAGDALDPAALRAIFATKARPATHPLILHALDPREHAIFDARAESLAVLWPGPLTLVLSRESHVPLHLTGGLDTVAVRVPAHPVALDILRRLGRPLAAPSANRFGQVSPTTAEHVLASLPGVDVLDGGPCTVGVESTIVDLSSPVASILRPGAIAAARIEALLGAPLGAPSGTAAPGTLPAHYAPRARVIVVDRAEDALGAHPGAAVIRRGDPGAYARRLYAELRAADAAGAAVVLCERCGGDGLGAAIDDRLARAAR